jgi:hypothetical protein
MTLKVQFQIGYTFAGDIFQLQSLVKPRIDKIVARKPETNHERQKWE